jgi:hypothetical protein
MHPLLALLILAAPALSDDPEPSAAPGEPALPETPPYDGPRLTVGVPELRGSLTVQQVRAVTLKHAKAVRYCYQRRVSEGLDEQGGLTVRFTIEPDGAVTKVKVRGDEVRDEQVLTCVGVRFERILFSEAADGGKTRVTVPLTLELP